MCACVCVWGGGGGYRCFLDFCITKLTALHLNFQYPELLPLNQYSELFFLYPVYYTALFFIITTLESIATTTTVSTSTAKYPKLYNFFIMHYYQ